MDELVTRSPPLIEIPLVMKLDEVDFMFRSFMLQATYKCVVIVSDLVTVEIRLVMKLGEADVTRSFMVKATYQSTVIISDLVIVITAYHYMTMFLPPIEIPDVA